MHALTFDNQFLARLRGDPREGPGIREVEAAWSRVKPTPVAAPRVVAYSREMAQTLGFSEADVRSPEFAQVFGGNALLPGMDPFAANYGGHQFGHWAGQLGDGRAITLGETLDAQGQRWELQLKGAGPTPYSRSADGRAVLRSSIREFLCSEAMHHLGIPTTRALSLVATGESVVRDMLYDGNPREEPGAIVCRVAPSFIRFGHFELPYTREDLEGLRALADFCIARDFPELRGQGTTLYGDWFRTIAQRTATLMAHWMRVGFVHGVMNTDNLSILGLTIDYGPYGWIDDFDPEWTPNTTDAGGRRYRFGWQPKIAYWNLTMLAHAVSPLFGEDVAPLNEGLQHFMDAYVAADRANTAGKLGLREARDSDIEQHQMLQDLLRVGAFDMTLFYRALSRFDPDADIEAQLHGPGDLFAHASYDPMYHEEALPKLWEFFDLYAARLQEDRMPAAERRAAMNAVNPKYVLRNYLAQEAIELAEQGDDSRVVELLEVMRKPYDEQPGYERFAQKRPEWAKTKVGCSMLSCSS